MPVFNILITSPPGQEIFNWHWSELLSVKLKCYRVIQLLILIFEFLFGIQVPTVPDKSKLIEESKQSVGLHLSSWINNGCLIQRYIIEYIPKSTSKGDLVSKIIKPDEKIFIIDDLEPATWYTLRMTAENNAGSAEVEYDFATLTASGGA